MQLALKRVYESPDDRDGLRILVDRLWPRGIRKDRARIDLWLREIAPSDELRRWFGHDPEKWDEFRRRYIAELDEHSAVVARLLERLGNGRGTLLFAARDTRHNNAVVLKDYLLTKG